MKRLLVIFLILAAMGQAATYYVRSDGNNANDGSANDAAHAWLTLEYAIDTATDDSEPHTIYITDGTFSEASNIDAIAGKTLTIIGSTTGTTLLQATGSSMMLFDNAGANTGTMEYRNISFQSTVAGACYGVRFDAAVTDVTLTFTNCTFLTHADNTTVKTVTLNTAAGATTRNITFTGGSASGKGDVAQFQFYDAGNVTITGMTINKPSTNTGIATFQFGYTNKVVTITDNTITNGEGYSLQIIASTATATTALTSVTFANNTQSGGSLVLCLPVTGVAYPIYVYNNILTSGNVYGINIGSNTAEVIADMGYVYVVNNSVTKSGTTPGHGLLIGKGVIAGLVSGNYVNVSADEGEYAIVSKANNVTFSNNIAIGDYALTPKGSQKSTYVNNTLISDAGGALYLLNDPEATPNAAKATSGCTFLNNIFYGVGATASAVFSADTEYADCVFDYNCYYGGTNLIVIAAGGKTLATAKDWWETNGTYAINKSNMTNAVNINPGLDANYKATSSALQNAGSPILLKSDGTVLLRNPIGATAGAGAEKSVFGVKRSVFGN